MLGGQVLLRKCSFVSTLSATAEALVLSFVHQFSPFLLWCFRGSLVLRRPLAKASPVPPPQTPGVQPTFYFVSKMKSRRCVIADSFLLQPMSPWVLLVPGFPPDAGRNAICMCMSRSLPLMFVTLTHLTVLETRFYWLSPFLNFFSLSLYGVFLSTNKYGKCFLSKSNLLLTLSHRLAPGQSLFSTLAFEINLLKE